jgi:hypothetical protein
VFATANVDAGDYSKLNASELQAAAEESPFSDRTAIAERAVDLLLATNFSSIDDSSQQLIELAQPALADLSDEKREKLSQFLDDSPKAGKLSFEQLKARCALQAAAGQDQDAPAELVEEWVNAIGLEKLSVDELAWCYRQSLPNDVDRKEFTVTWSGVLTPPHNGKYTFSVSPINVNSLGHEQVRHLIKVSVAGQSVLETPAKPAGKQESQDHVPTQAGMPVIAEWKPEGRPVSLVADKPVPVQVEMKYSCNEVAERNPASAILFWEGPGINRQLVPTKVLAGPEGKTKLRAEYRWPVGAEERFVVEESDNIDFLVDNPANIAPQNPKFVEKLADRLCSLATSKHYLDECAAGKTQHVFLCDDAIAAGLSAASRERFLEVLSAHEGVLNSLPAEQVVTLYEGFRFGNEEHALDVVGQWMQAHADITPEITLDFFRVNRQPYWELGQLLGGQFPEHVKLLQERYLVLEDGRCVLPAAYTLSYATLAQDVTRPSVFDPRRQTLPATVSGNWNDVLAAELADDEVSGDLRVNWLLARAQAKEAIPDPVVDHPSGREQLFAGKEWLTEARLIAESEAIQQRLGYEEIARLAAYRMWKEASEVGESHLSPTEVASLQKTLSQLETRADSLIVAEQRRSLDSQLEEFERRRQEAVARSDDAAVSGYTATINRLQDSLDELSD